MKSFIIRAVGLAFVAGLVTYGVILWRGTKPLGSSPVREF